MRRTEVAIVGSGFAGALAARVLRRLGREVLLIERGRHPRFALGESTTPLGNLAMKRLARRYDLPDLHDLAAHGRWRRRLPELGRGLKRGFTFYAHRPGEPYRCRPDNDRRLLVAASPDDEVADTHWLRVDVDRHFVERAVAAGAGYLDEAELTEIEERGGRWRLHGRRRGRPLELAADLVIDGSGPAGFLVRRLRVPDGRDPVFDTSLLYGHFTGVAPFPEVVARTGTELSPGPYPDEWAAVHHLLDGGWMYSLRFDHDLVSAGFLLRDAGGTGGGPAGAARRWQALLARYPSLGAQYAEAHAVGRVRQVDRVAYRRGAAAGPGWVLLPHTFAFYDPLFSTGIAWSLLAVERLGLLFETWAGRPLTPAVLEPGLARYAELLAKEADQIEALLEAAYRAMGNFSLFTTVSFLYFAAVSFAEVAQRLAPEGSEEGAWTGFLGCDDPVIAPLVGAVRRRLVESGGGRRDPRQVAEIGEWIGRRLAPRNLVGLADPRRGNLYPVDLEVLVERASLLGRTPAEMRALLPRLRA